MLSLQKPDKPPPRLIWLSGQCGQGLVCAAMIGADRLSWPHNRPVEPQRSVAEHREASHASIWPQILIQGSCAVCWEPGPFNFSPLKEAH